MPRTLYKYRVYCTTETDYKYAWSETPITVCPTNGVHTLDNNSLTIVGKITDQDTTISNLPLSCFDELRVTERTPVIELKSIYGKSTLRDIYTTTGNSTITNTIGDGEYVLTTTANGTDSAILQSAERGRYVAGMQCEVGIAARMPTAPTGNQVIKIGLFDTNNGFYFKVTSTNIYACVLRDNIETAIERTAWNNDKLDGTGPSKYTYDSTDGNIFIIRFSWYGYGNALFHINATNNENIQDSWLAHSYNPQGQTSTKTPNLPLCVSVANNGTTTPLSVYVAGRQYSILGRYTPITRTTSAYRIAFTVTSNTIFLPVLSIRRKNGYQGNAIKAIGADIVPTANMLVQVRVNTTLTGASFITPQDTQASETAAEVDISSTAVTGGIPIWAGLVTGDTKGTISTRFDQSYDLSEQQTLTICARTLANTNADISIVFQWTEEW